MGHCTVIISILDSLLFKPICEPDTENKSTAEAPLGTYLHVGY